MAEVFNLTDRDMESTKYQFQFDLATEVKKWPESAVVLIMGSGTRGKLEKDLKSIRRDITCYSIDPSLAFDPSKKQIHDLADGEVLLYEPLDNRQDTYTYRGESAHDFHRNRVKAHNADLPIAAVLHLHHIVWM